MFCSAVSLFVVAHAVAAGQQQAALQDPVWEKVKPVLARIDGIGQPAGLAVLIDARGFFLAHRSAVQLDAVVGTINGRLVPMTLTAVDEQTQLALLRAENWPITGPEPVKVTGKLALGSKVVAATPTGPLRGELVRDNRIGQIKPSLRYAPLSEIRLESNIAPIGGALVFDSSARLVGVLGATLVSPANVGQNTLTKTFDRDAKQSNYGPQGMTVAYALSPAVLERVVQGLLSPSHKVLHPSIGVFFRSGPEPGALLEEVVAGSSADKAGLKVGDLVVAVDGKPVQSHVDFAIAVFQSNVGDTMELKVRRAGVDLTVRVPVVSQQSLS
ncbi:MAG: serine protease [Armatimonadetes bacterium]|nr:serine protease [Armatimonadota bacterium]